MGKHRWVAERTHGWFAGFGKLPLNIAEEEAFRLWTDKEPIPQSENVFTFGTVWDYYNEWRGSKN